MKRDILFDLDGTLTDPGEGITNCVAYALEKFGIHEPNRRSLYRFIGPPLLEAFSEFYGLSPEQARQGLRYYRERFGEVGIFENRVYPGVAAMLAGLKASGRRLIVATSKPEPYSVRILAHFGLAEYFDFVAGATMDEKRSKKGDVIRYALEARSICPERALMVGDRKHDMLGAKENGLTALGVLYGYGDRAELIAAGADLLAETPERVEALIEAME